MKVGLQSNQGKNSLGQKWAKKLTAGSPSSTALSEALVINEGGSAL